jgi:hypothetical protein
MTLRVVGAGLGRTGTSSLKIALEQVLGGRCYHMAELFGRPDDTAVWHAAVRGEAVDWGRFMSDFVASVDWPGCAVWRELHAANRGGIVLLSTRESAQAWWESMERTIVPQLSSPAPANDAVRVARRAMVLDMMDRFDPAWRDRDAAIAAYERHNDDVRRTVPAERLIEWRPNDGWEPICTALDVPTPATPFPHANTTTEFRASQGLSPDSG